MPGKERPKASSKAQQTTAGIAHAIQKGEMKGKPGMPATEMAKSMGTADVKSMASGSTKGKPEHKGYTVIDQGSSKVRKVK
jgi:hypothetical protein